MEKVKVNKEVYDALVRWKLECQKPLEKGLEQKVKFGGFITDKFKPLNSISLNDFSKCLIIGYELEETPGEHLLEVYDSMVGWGLGEEAEGFVKGMKYTLNALKIKIEGINS